MNVWRAGDVEFVVSEHILQELDRTLRKPYFVARLDESDRLAYITLILEDAVVVEVSDPIPTVLSDPADNLVLATALSANVPFIVSGDRELQRLGEYRGIRIVSARDFIDLIVKEQDAEANARNA